MPRAPLSTLSRLNTAAAETVLSQPLLQQHEGSSHRHSSCCCSRSPGSSRRLTNNDNAPPCVNSNCSTCSTGNHSSPSVGGRSSDVLPRCDDTTCSSWSRKKSGRAAASSASCETVGDSSQQEKVTPAAKAQETATAAVTTNDDICVVGVTRRCSGEQPFEDEHRSIQQKQRSGPGRSRLQKLGSHQQQQQVEEHEKEEEPQQRQMENEEKQQQKKRQWHYREQQHDEELTCGRVTALAGERRISISKVTHSSAAAFPATKTTREVKHGGKGNFLLDVEISTETTGGRRGRGTTAAVAVTDLATGGHSASTGSFLSLSTRQTQRHRYASRAKKTAEDQDAEREKQADAGEGQKTGEGQEGGTQQEEEEEEIGEDGTHAAVKEAAGRVGKADRDILNFQKALELLRPTLGEYAGQRDENVSAINKYIDRLLEKRRGGLLYLYGASGTGKTCTALHVLQQKLKCPRHRHLLHKRVVTVSCAHRERGVLLFSEMLLRMNCPAAADSPAGRETFFSNSLKAALARGDIAGLVTCFTKFLQKSSKFWLCLIDEVDFLTTAARRRSELLRGSNSGAAAGGSEWASPPKGRMQQQKQCDVLLALALAATHVLSRIIVVAISNSAELAERFAGLPIPSVAFSPYDAQQLMALLLHRLQQVKGTSSTRGAIEKKGVQQQQQQCFAMPALLVFARKAANTYGDFRMALSGLCRAVEDKVTVLQEERSAALRQLEEAMKASAEATQEAAATAAAAMEEGGTVVDEASSLSSGGLPAATSSGGCAARLCAGVAAAGRGVVSAVEERERGDAAAKAGEAAVMEATDSPCGELPLLLHNVKKRCLSPDTALANDSSRRTPCCSPLPSSKGRCRHCSSSLSSGSSAVPTSSLCVPSSSAAAAVAAGVVCSDGLPTHTAAGDDVCRLRDSAAAVVDVAASAAAATNSAAAAVDSKNVAAGMCKRLRVEDQTSAAGCEGEAASSSRGRDRQGSCRLQCDSSSSLSRDEEEDSSSICGRSSISCNSSTTPNCADIVETRVEVERCLAAAERRGEGDGGAAAPQALATAAPAATKAAELRLLVCTAADDAQQQPQAEQQTLLPERPSTAADACSSCSPLLSSCNDAAANKEEREVQQGPFCARTPSPVKKSSHSSCRRGSSTYAPGSSSSCSSRGSQQRPLPTLMGQLSPAAVWERQEAVLVGASADAAADDEAAGKKDQQHVGVDAVRRHRSTHQQQDAQSPHGSTSFDEDDCRCYTATPPPSPSAGVQTQPPALCTLLSASSFYNSSRSSSTTTSSSSSCSTSSSDSDSSVTSISRGAFARRRSSTSTHFTSSSSSRTWGAGGQSQRATDRYCSSSSDSSSSSSLSSCSKTTSTETIARSSSRSAGLLALSSEKNTLSPTAALQPPTDIQKNSKATTGLKCPAADTAAASSRVTFAATAAAAADPQPTSEQPEQQGQQDPAAAGKKKQLTSPLSACATASPKYTEAADTQGCRTHYNRSSHLMYAAATESLSWSATAPSEDPLAAAAAKSAAATAPPHCREAAPSSSAAAVAAAAFYATSSSRTRAFREAKAASSLSRPCVGLLHMRETPPRHAAATTIAAAATATAAEPARRRDSARFPVVDAHAPTAHAAASPTTAATTINATRHPQQESPKKQQQQSVTVGSADSCVDSSNSDSSSTSCHSHEAAAGRWAGGGGGSAGPGNSRSSSSGEEGTAVARLAVKKPFIEEGGKSNTTQKHISSAHAGREPATAAASSSAAAALIGVEALNSRAGLLFGNEQQRIIARTQGLPLMQQVFLLAACRSALQRIKLQMQQEGCSDISSSTKTPQQQWQQKKQHKQQQKQQPQQAHAATHPELLRGCGGASLVMFSDVQREYRLLREELSSGSILTENISVSSWRHAVETFEQLGLMRPSSSSRHTSNAAAAGGAARGRSNGGSGRLSSSSPSPFRMRKGSGGSPFLKRTPPPAAAEQEQAWELQLSPALMEAAIKSMQPLLSASAFEDPFAMNFPKE